MVRKKKNALVKKSPKEHHSEHREECTVYRRTMFLFAEEANQFALNERNNFEWRKKKRSVNIQFLNSVMKDITPFHKRNKEKEKKKSSPESLHGNIVNLTTI
ncbi:hypothetical protein TNCV_4044881 [Trichonephila clavipes]|nr:hypothetical protein TNCV_4044881 [Trichonephila clavipes]